ncbi:hypothetical protein [Hyphococcus sp.]|uniref:hypothetical protein n=1 Tax=Hyphococcus sp. TaxID=2038636 RepID=UPI00208508C4|nr:MAG: hypothetical protein DHS20C04_06980 [Marinicaulis sp.]
MAPPSDPQQLTIEQIRSNIAFENMVVSVLAGAFSGGVMIFALKLVQMLLGEISFSAVVSILLETIFVAIAIFLMGFFTSVAVGAPLYNILENSKRRTVWPYLVAALSVAIIVFAFSVGGLPSIADVKIETALAIFAPAIIIALTFARLMKPHWLAAKKAEDAAAGPVYFRLH